MKTVIILGGTSHIAKGLISRFLKQPDIRLEWFGRSAQRMNAFLDGERLSGKITVHEGYDGLSGIRGDVLINCIGAGTPDKLRTDYTLWFTVLEQYDDLCIRYLQQTAPSTLYIDFSSGAVYGHNAGEKELRIDPNGIRTADFYALAKIYSEAKHRAFAGLNIVDIRIFSYFSRYADPDSGYLMTDVLKALRDGAVLKTSAGDLVRDYVSPDDLFALIQCCIGQERINTAMDAFSSKPVSKQEILSAFGEKFGLRIETVSGGPAASPNSTASVYVPHDHSGGRIGYVPRHTSLDGLLLETAACLKR